MFRWRAMCGPTPGNDNEHMELARPCWRPDTARYIRSRQPCARCVLHLKKPKFVLRIIRTEYHGTDAHSLQALRKLCVIWRAGCCRGAGSAKCSSDVWQLRAVALLRR
jgi:hypothetical protein